MIAHRCRNCTWWDCTHPSVADIPPELGKTRLGLCRKHKPGALRLGNYFYGVQPVMDGDEFCGEFRQDEER